MRTHLWSKDVIGARVGRDIFIHPDLVNYPKLYTQVLAHELEHTNGYSKKDFINDFFGNGLKGVKWDYYKFLFTHPRVWFSFLPYSPINDKWYLDINMGIFWAIVILFILGVKILT